MSGIGKISACVILLSLSAGPQQVAPRDQRAQYDADVPKTILELQQFRQSNSIHIRSTSGREGVATLVNLNPNINSWYLLKVAWSGPNPEANYHLESPQPHARRISLDPQYPSGIVIAEASHHLTCDLFSGDVLEQAKTSPRIYYPLCSGQIFLRNPATGHRSTLEAATEFLREHIWGGEKIVDLGHIVMGDMHRETAQIGPGATAAPARIGEFPSPASIDEQYANRALESNNLGIDVEGSGGGIRMTPGAWYPANGNPGVYVSLMQPNLADPAILQTYKTFVNPLDSVEASALAYLVAFDLDRFDLGFALGTDHPKVGWSDQVVGTARNAALPGPDGIGSISPLVATGSISPDDAGKTVATFTGGFKRMHGAFKFGDLALKNHGSHYGFIESGVVLSKLQPGLATIFVLDDGTVGMKSWTEADDKLLFRIKYARQNGVPIIESQGPSQASVPGPLVNKWGAGNWSGSEEGKLRTMRAGAAMQRNHGKRFLIYAVFSDATPSAMARIFQAYRCEYAMLLDMNALEHTYLAVYRRSGPQLFVDHLLKGMNVLEKSDSGEVVPRFLGYADNRDFFYIMRR